MTAEGISVAGEPMAWWITTAIITLLVIVLSVLLKLGYNSFTVAVKDLASAVKDLVAVTHEIRESVAVQNEKNEENAIQHLLLFKKVEDEHGKVNGIEKDVLRLNIVHEKLCPVKPLSGGDL